MKNKVLLSVVTPVHNTEIRLLKRAMKSVLEQSMSYARFEWIFVWHNCSDKYMQDITPLVDHLSQKGINIVNIRVNDETATPSVPRNIGLKSAVGEGIIFMDSDDTLDKNCLKVAMSALRRDNADCVLFKMRRKSGTPRFMIVHQPFPKEENSYHYVLDKYKWDIDRYMYGGMLTVTTKLYRRDFLLRENIIFDESVGFAEDALFNLHVLNRANRISVLAKFKGYNYYYNRNSLSHRFVKSKEQLINLAEDFRKIYETGISYGNNMDCLMCELMDCFSVIYLYSRKNTDEESNKVLYSLLGDIIKNLKLPDIKGVYPEFFMNYMKEFPLAILERYLNNL